MLARSRLKLVPPITAPIPSSQRSKAYPRAPAEALARAAAVKQWGLYDVRHRRQTSQSLRRLNRETGVTPVRRKYAFAERFPHHGRRGPGRGRKRFFIRFCG